MKTTSYIVKVTARTALKSKWTTAAATAAVLLFTLFLNTFLASLLSVSLGQIAATVAFALLSLFLSAPVFLGTVRFFWRLLFSAEDAPVSVFYYFSDKKRYHKAIKLAFSIVLRLFFFAVVLYAPSQIARALSETGFYDLIDIPIPLWTSNLYYFSLFLSGLATVFLLFISLRYFLAPVLFVADEEIEVLEAVHMSVMLAKTVVWDFLGLLFSMLGWIVLSVLVFPLPFTLPYLLTSYAVFARFAIADYNKKIKPHVPHADFSFSM